MPRRRWPRGFLSKIDPAHLLRKEAYLKGSPYSLERLHEFRGRRSNNLVISKSVTDAVSSHFLRDHRLAKEERKAVQKLAHLAQDATVGWIERMGLIVPKETMPLVSSFLQSCAHMPIIEDYLKERGKKFDLEFCAPRVIEQMKNPKQSFESFLADLERDVV